MENFHFPSSPLAGYGDGGVPGARKLYVRSSPMDLSPLPVEPRFATLAAALAHCRAGAGDEIHILPGHSESISTATALSGLVAGTKIIGHGPAGYKPEFRWTATAGNWAVNVAGVSICGLRLRMDGANGITSGITVTGADCSITDCDIEVASGATAKAAIMCTVSTGAHRFVFARNRVRGTATHNVTDGVLISAVVDNVVIADNDMFASATAANGLVRASAAATALKLLRNRIVNTHTSSTVAAALGSAAVTGVVGANWFGHEAVATITSGTNGISFSGSVAVRFFDNWICDAAGGAIASIPTAVS